MQLAFLLRNSRTELYRFDAKVVKKTKLQKFDGRLIRRLVCAGSVRTGGACGGRIGRLTAARTGGPIFRTQRYADIIFTEEFTILGVSVQYKSGKKNKIARSAKS